MNVLYINTIKIIFKYLFIKNTIPISNITKQIKFIETNKKN